MEVTEIVVGQGDHDRRTMAERVVPWVLLSSYAVLCLTLWHGEQWRSSWDSAVYLMTGRSLAEGGGYTYQGLPYSLRPPAFSWLLSFFLADGAFDPGAINGLIMACAAAAVVAVFVVFRKLHGTWIALAAALLCGTSPAFVANFNRILSEYPFQLLTFIGFGCVLAADARGKGWIFRAVGAGLSLGLAMWFRSVAVLVVPGFFVGGLRVRERLRWWAGALLPTVLLVALALPWVTASRAALAQAPSPSEQWLLHDYATAMFHVDPGDPASAWVDLDGYLERIASNGSELLGELAWSCSGSRSTLWGLCVMALLLAGWLRSVLRGATVLDWFAAVYTVLVLTYFTYAQRLVLPLMPFVPLYALLALQGLGTVLSRRTTTAGRASRMAASAPLILGVIVLGVVNAGTLSDSLHPGQQHGGRLARRWADNALTANWVREHTPADAVLLCRRAPELAFLTGRRSATYRFARKPDLVRRSGADYVIFDGAPPAAVRSETRQASLQSWSLPGNARGGGIVIQRVR